MKRVSEHIPGYSYGEVEVANSPVSILDLEKLKTSAGFTEADQRYLQIAREVLTGQTKQIVVMNETIKLYLAARGNSAEEVAKMLLAWCKSIQMQLALWIDPYGDTRQPPTEWRIRIYLCLVCLMMIRSQENGRHYL